jgi:DNA-binding transcriptional LysR family regulator
LNRTTRRVSLTEIGRAYYERSLHIHADLDEADCAGGTLQATPRGGFAFIAIRSLRGSSLRS